MRGKPVVLHEFHGLNAVDDPLSLGLGVAQSLANVEPNGKGGLHRREGMTQVAVTTHGQVEQMFPGVSSADVYARTATTYHVIGGPDIQTGLTPTTGTGALGPKTAAGTALAFFMTDQVNPRKFYDGAVTANWTPTAGTVPAANFLISAGGRMIAADILGAPIREIQASAAGDPFNWGTAVGQGWKVDLEMFDSGLITGLVAVGPYVLVFTQTAIHVIYDLDTGANRVLSRQIGARPGARFERYVISDGSTAYFWSTDGIFSCDGSSLRKLSGNIFAALPSLTLGYMAWLNGYVVVVGIPTSGRLGAMYLLDLATGLWWLHTTPDPLGAMHRQQVAGGHENLYIQRNFFAEINSWRPHHHETFTPIVPADGTVSQSTFTASWVAGTLDFGQPAVGKRIRSIEGAGLATAGALSIGADRDGSAVAARSFGFGAARSVKKVPTWGVGKLWTPSLSDTTTSLWTLDALEFDVVERKG